MRLLNAHTLELEEYFEKDVPPYAILSHRWGAEEVRFAEMPLQRSKRKAGFAKIRSFCLLAVQEGFEYAWVDTCCINKDSSAELSEAINSMFRWYAEAAVCYVYLADVSGNTPKPETQESLEKSEWFTRGWTLQELIAPRSVIFYGAEWTKLGNRESLKPTITSITGIHASALGASINSIRKNFSVAQRMSWAANRITTRVEDQAYCLLGIFNVNMHLLYGEKEKAFTRLQEQIINETTDQTIFCWSDVTITTSGGKLNHYHYYANKPTDLLAPSPLLFKNCSGIAQVPDLDISSGFKITKTGLKITSPVYSLKERDKFSGVGDHLIYLRCYDQDAPNHHLAIMLRDLGDNNFARKNQTLCRLPGTLWEGTENKMVFIMKHGVTPSYRKILQIGKSIVFRVDTSSSVGEILQVTESWPPAQWHSDSHKLPAPAWHDTDISVNNWSWHAVLRLQLNTQAHARLRGNKGYSTDCSLALGYDGIHDRCWCLLRPGSGNLEKIWESSVDTSVQGATYKLSSSKFDWTIRVDLAQFPEQETVQLEGETLEYPPSQSPSVIPVKIDISKARSKIRKKTISEPFSVSNKRHGGRLAGEQSFASLVNHLVSESLCE